MAVRQIAALRRSRDGKGAIGGLLSFPERNWSRNRRINSLGCNKAASWLLLLSPFPDESDGENHAADYHGGIESTYMSGSYIDHGSISICCMLVCLYPQATSKYAKVDGYVSHSIRVVVVALHPSFLPTAHCLGEELQIAISVFQNGRFDEGVANSTLFSELIFATIPTQDVDQEGVGFKSTQN